MEGSQWDRQATLPGFADPRQHSTVFNRPRQAALLPLTVMVSPRLRVGSCWPLVSWEAVRA